LLISFAVQFSIRFWQADQTISGDKLKIKVRQRLNAPVFWVSSITRQPLKLKTAQAKFPWRSADIHAVNGFPNNAFPM
jgi:hypothetical protein